MMAVSKEAVMAMKSYQNQAQLLVKDYLLADPFLPYTSVLGGIFACKMIYEFGQLFSSLYFKSYASLTKIQRIEWNNRCISTLHAFFISTMSLYFVFFSEMYSDHRHDGLVTFRSSPLSIFTLGVSVGYFLTDLGMILWVYPSLGGMEYYLLNEDEISQILYVSGKVTSRALSSTPLHKEVYNKILHHLLSGIAVAYSMLTGEGQVYTYMVLVSEITTPGINLRWFLDIAGMKRSNAYLINGVGIFFSWLVARVLLFGYLFYHVYLHYLQIEQMHTFGVLLVFVVPSALGIMNLMWFGKIIKGLMKQLAKRQ